MGHTHSPRTLTLPDTLALTESDALDFVEDSALLQDVAEDFHTRELVTCEVWLPILRQAKDQTTEYSTF